MPIYMYECRLCGHSFEEQLPVDKRDDPIADGCPKCNPEFSSLIRLCSNRGGFRLGQGGSVGWASDGYAATWGDAEVHKARKEGRKPDVY